MPGLGEFVPVRFWSSTLMSWLNLVLPTICLLDLQCKKVGFRPSTRKPRVLGVPETLRSAAMEFRMEDENGGTGSRALISESQAANSIRHPAGARGTKNQYRLSIPILMLGFF